MGHLDEDRKLHLAVGLGHAPPASRRRPSPRTRPQAAQRTGSVGPWIASVAGWSKSTIDRDLKTSPFEELIAVAAAEHDRCRRDGEDADQRRRPRAFYSLLTEASGGFCDFFTWGDSQWKRGNWPPPPEEHVAYTLTLHTVARTLERMFAISRRTEVPPDFPDWQ